MGYAHKLGVALLQNSSVTSLCLCVFALVGSWELDTNSAMNPLLKYIATSHALTSVEFCKGKRGYHDVLVGRLLDAAAKNSCIVEITINYDICVPSESLAHS
jgi:urea transporter